MKITHKIDIYLDDYRPTPEIVVMQCDANTRELQFSLYAANQPWQAPGEAKLYVSYRKPDGTGGFYDTLPDGTHACIAGDGNTVTAILAEQVLTVPGKVPVAISIQLDGAILATFSVQLRVMPNPGIGAMKSENYFCLKAAVDAAAVAAQKPVRIITVFSSGDGKYATDHDMSMIKAMIDSNTPFVCYWYDKNIMLHLAGFQTDVAFEFTAVDDIKEYRVVITKDGVNTYVTDLAKMSDIPTKTSELEHDSGFLTTAPVTSVNGQTGEVKLPTVVKVPLIRQEDGTYKPGISHEDILAAYNAGNFVFCEYSGRLLQLIVASTALCSFGCVHSGNVYTVNINSASAVASVVPLASGGGSGSGSDGITPHIGANGNWFIGETDTGMPSRGEPGPQGVSGVYIGSGEMPEGYNIQIDPTGEAPVLVQSVNGVKPDENGNVEVTGASLTSEQVAALDDLFRLAAYTEDASAKYAAFRHAFGLDGSEPDTPDIPDELGHTHSYVSSVTKEATCETAGVRTYTCPCGHSYTQSIPATGHTYVDGVCTVCGSVDPDCDVGGDEPVYQLAEEVSFDGTGEYDTVYQLFNFTADDSKPHSIVLEFTTAAHTGGVFRCGNDTMFIEYVNYWVGGVRVWAVRSCNGGTWAPTYSTADRAKIVVTKEADNSKSYQVYFIENDAVSVVSAQRGTGFYPFGLEDTIKLGTNGFNGIIHDFKVYERVLTDAEINSYLGVTE